LGLFSWNGPVDMTALFSERSVHNSINEKEEHLLLRDGIAVMVPLLPAKVLSGS